MCGCLNSSKTRFQCDKNHWILNGFYRIFDKFLALSLCYTASEIEGKAISREKNEHENELNYSKRPFICRQSTATIPQQ